MKSDDFMAENVVACCDGAWNSYGPRVVVGDQLIRSPGSWGSGIIYQARLVDLEELEGSLVDGGAIPVAGREIIDDRAVVRFGPGVPFHHHSRSGSNSCAGFPVGGRLVADDITASVGIWSDKAEIGGGFCPADGVGWSGHVWILVDEVASVAIIGQ